MSDRFEVREHDDGVLCVDLRYPRVRGGAAVEVGLECVRATDAVRVAYDHGRNGWSILQASRFEWEVGEEPDEDWQEVAFVESWAREVAKRD